MLGAVLDALVTRGPHDGAVPPSFWTDTPGTRCVVVVEPDIVAITTIVGTTRYGLVTTDVREAFELLQARDLVPLDCRSHFGCGDCGGMVGEAQLPDGTFARCPGCTGLGHLPHPPTVAALVAWGSGVIHPESHHPAGTAAKSYHPKYAGRWPTPAQRFSRGPRSGAPALRRVVAAS